MKYFYLKPFNPQYYFPEEYEEYPFLKTLFTPYTFKGRIYWWVWQHFKIVRTLCSVGSIANIFPIEIFRKYIADDSVMAFNKGTPGPGQKTSILGFDPGMDNYFIIKFAETEIAKRNLVNEIKVLQKLSNKDFVPKLLVKELNEKYSLLKTTAFSGSKYKKQKLDNKLVDLLCTIGSLKVTGFQKFDVSVKTCFAHGDFCPWNMIKNENNEIKVFDWEMAGEYPVGYDLFTFVFQTSFLLQPQTKISQLLNRNVTVIEDYFKKMGICDWKPYLLDFARIRSSIEKTKGENSLHNAYQLLIGYVKKKV